MERKIIFFSVIFLFSIISLIKAESTQIIKINYTQSNEICNFSRGDWLDDYIPLPNFNIGESKCSEVGLIKDLFLIDDNWNIIGIKLWFVMSIVFIILIIILIKSKKSIKKLLNKR